MGRNTLTTSELYQLQMDMEKEMIDLGVQAYHDSVQSAEEGGRSADTTYARSLARQITDPVVDYLKERVARSRSAYTAPLKELNLERAVVIALRTMFTGVINGGKKPAGRTMIATSIAQALQLELKMQSLCDKNPEYMKEVQTSWKRKKASDVRHKSNVVNAVLAKEDLSWKAWDKAVQVGVGGYMLETIVHCTDLFEFKNISIGRNKTLSTVILSVKADEWIAKHKGFFELVQPIYRPMIVPPTDWSRNSKPYLSDALNSTYNAVRLRYRKQSKEYRDLGHRTYADLSMAQATAWRVNLPVLKFIKDLCKLKNTALVPSDEMEEKPPYPFEDKVDFDTLSDSDKATLREWKEAVREIHTSDVARRSNRRRLQAVINLADKYTRFDRIYFPHSLDSRGRIYSLPTVLQPQGDDICKALLEFSEGEVLTDSGLQQLKLQIAGKYGLDKESREVRLKWFDDNEQAILACAESPLDMLEWLSEADKAFSVYASSLDYYSWKKDPQKPVHGRVNKDGACNGLQHFAAMQRDGDLGESVNLTPSDPSETPNSIYKVVADETQKILESRTDHLAQAWLLYWRATSKSGTVDYKCMKRPVMTLPYSATMFSRLEYIREYLRGKDTIPKDYFGEEYGKAVLYFAEAVTLAMDRRIPSATKLLDWLKLACTDILEANDHVEWTTPAGLRVYHKKQKNKSKIVKLLFEGKQIRYSFKDSTERVDVQGMASAIAPNFVHSMDACHMLMIVRRCFDSNIKQLHLVHDDYGCHYNHGELLESIAKEEFYNMYDKHNPIRDFYEQYSEVITRKPPESLDTLDLSEIVKSTYAFD